MKQSFNRDELADRWGVSTDVVDDQTRAGKIPHLRFGTRVVYPLAVIEEWEREQALARLAPEVPRPADRPRRRRRVVQAVQQAKEAPAE